MMCMYAHCFFQADSGFSFSYLNNLLSTTIYSKMTLLIMNDSLKWKNALNIIVGSEDVKLGKITILLWPGHKIWLV